MRRPLLLMLMLVVLAAATAILVTRRESPSTVSDARRDEHRTAGIVNHESPPPAQPLTDELVAVPESPDVDDASEEPSRMFRANAAGDLRVTERTRLNIEKLLALYSQEDLQHRMTLIEEALPPAAYGQLVELMSQYANFIAASKQAYPPDAAPATVEDAIAQHDGLHALRVAHFGAEAAEAMYGSEERIGRQLLEFMNLERHEGLTMEEKAERAQQMLMASPDLAQSL